MSSRSNHPFDDPRRATKCETLEQFKKTSYRSRFRYYDSGRESFAQTAKRHGYDDETSKKNGEKGLDEAGSNQLTAARVSDELVSR